MVSLNTDCRSDEGITVGLIDSIISISRVLAARDLNTKLLLSLAIQEALIDFLDDKDFSHIVLAARHAKKFRRTPDQMDP